MAKTKQKVARTLSRTQLLRKFPDEKACIQWLEEVRWNNVPTCNKCGECKKISNPASKPHTYWCGSCRKHFTVTTGTIFHATKTTLQNWMVAIYCVMTARKGISALQLSKELGVGYSTAWYMMHRIREGYDSKDLKLSRIVEMDEAYVGGKEKNKHRDKKLKAGRGTAGKTALMGATERGGPVVIQVVDKVDTAAATKFAKKVIKEGSTVYTDEASVYRNIPFSHETVNHSKEVWVRGNVHTNSMESVWALFKRALHGTWHNVSLKHLHRYANEVTMRLDIGRCDVDTIDRMSAFIGMIGGRRISYNDLVN